MLSASSDSDECCNDEVAGGFKPKFRGVLLCFISTDAAGVQGTEGSPGVTAPKPFSPTSVAGYAGPPSSLQTTPDSAALLSLGQSGVPQ